MNKVSSSVALTNNGSVFSGTLDNVDPGIYFVVFKVTGTISRVTGVISVDTVGFVVRPALTSVYINGASKTFNTDGTISIPAKN